MGCSFNQHVVSPLLDNLIKIYPYLLLKPHNVKEEITYELDAESNLLDLANVITRAPEFRTRCDGFCKLDILLGNYEISNKNQKTHWQSISYEFW